MTSPKDVLEGFIGSLGNVTFEKSPFLYNHIQAAKAAIPVAELQQQIVDLVYELPLMGSEIDALFIQLEELKCTPQK